MAGGLHYESLSELPPGVRQQVASKIMAQAVRPDQVADQKGKTSKYHNVKVMLDGHKFDSKKECRRFQALMDAVREGVIYDLRLQRNFTLQEGYTTPEGERIQAIVYQADFTYRVRWPWHLPPTCCSAEDLEYWSAAASKGGDGVEIIEDVKTRPTRTRVYINKYKMMADQGHHIREV